MPLANTLGLKIPVLSLYFMLPQNFKVSQRCEFCTFLGPFENVCTAQGIYVVTWEYFQFFYKPLWASHYSASFKIFISLLLFALIVTLSSGSCDVKTFDKYLWYWAVSLEFHGGEGGLLSGFFQEILER